MLRAVLPAAAALAMAANGHSAVAKKASWPQTNHDGARTGYNPAEDTVSPKNVSSLRSIWTQTVPGEVSSFALRGKTLYFQGGDPSTLTAVDARTGAIRWSVPIGNDTHGNASIAVDKAHVYAGCADPKGTTNGAICSYSPATGAVEWSFCGGCDVGGNGGVNSAFAYDKGVLYAGFNAPINVGNPPEQFVVAVDGASGNQLWAVDFGSANSGGSLNGSAITAGEKNVYASCLVGGKKAALCALSKAGGALAWHYDLNDSSSGLDDIGIAEGNDVVYANVNGSASQIAALNAANGKVKWKHLETGVCCGAPPPAITDTDLYVPFRDPKNGLASTIVALDAASGKEEWKSDIGAACASPSVANGVVYEKNCGGSNTVTVSAFNAHSGKLLWNNPDGAGGHNPPPIIANGTVYVANIATGLGFNIAAFRTGK